LTPAWRRSTVGGNQIPIMTSNAKTVAEYLAALPAERKAGVGAVRKAILANLPKGYEETMQYGMICYVVPHSLYPAGYHCDPRQALTYASLASQKSHMAIYLMCAYGNSEMTDWFRKAYSATGKKLDMGKSCVRFKKLEDLALDVIGQAIARVSVEKYIARVESMLAETKTEKRPGKAKSKSAAKPKARRAK
jgi:hypothetical protein